MIAHDPLILCLAPTGIVPTRALSAAVPLQPAEIVADVLACAQRGLSVVHLHARDEAGVPTGRSDVYARIIGGIREKRPDLIIGVSCSGRLEGALERRTEVLELSGDLKPDMASLTLSSMNFPSGASISPPDTVYALAAIMRERGIIPEFEIFDLGMANVLSYLVASGKVAQPLYANLLVGTLASAQPRFLDIAALVGALPQGVTYCLAGLGPAQLPVAAMAVAAAPGVRIGLEDNLWLDRDRQRPASNLELVERVHDLATLVGRRIMTPVALRRSLGLR